MATMVIDPKSISQLLAMKERVQLLDQSGKTLGYFEPPFTVWYPVDVSEAELDRREKEPGGLSTTEAIAYLKKARR